MQSNEIKWHRVSGTVSTRQGYSQYEGKIGDKVVADIALTGRPGVDNYPWDWSIDTGDHRDSGAADTYRSAKERVVASLLKAVSTRVEPSPAEVTLLTELRKEARKRVERQLDSLYRLWGGMDREALGAMLDGAQDATMNWTPPERRGGR